MRRREFIKFVGGAATTLPLRARAQNVAMRVLGFLHGGAPADFTTASSFNAGLKEVGLVQGQNVKIEHRWAYSQYDRLPALAAELITLKPDLLICGGSAEAVALKAATNSVPIVFLSVGDPVGIGLVQSLSQPGGNVTGLAVYVPGGFIAKQSGCCGKLSHQFPRSLC